MPYAGVQFADARTQLALRLANPQKTFWTDLELGVYIQEAFQVWAAATGYWRDSGLLTATAGTPWFNLASLRNGSGVNPIMLTTSSRSLLTQLEYHLLEPPSSAPVWAGTEMFSYEQIQAALQRRADQFIADTGTNVAQALVTVPAAPINRLPLTAIPSLVDLRRLVWIDATTGYVTPMVPGDEWEFNVYSVGWQQKPGVPQQYSILATPPLSVIVKPPPLATGSLDVIYTATKHLAAFPADDTMPILQDYGWAIKWGAIADLLNLESESNDTGRASYAEQRYQMGVEACRAAATIMQGYYLGVQLPLTTVEEMDRWSANWQNAPGASPQGIGVAGLNLFALSPVPDAAYQIGVDVVASAPIPVLDADYLQIGPEELEAIYGYAQHIAAFKQGGEEFASTMPLFQNFIRLAMQQNARLKMMSSFSEFLVDRETRAEAMRPRIEEMEVGAKQ